MTVGLRRRLFKPRDTVFQKDVLTAKDGGSMLTPTPFRATTFAALLAAASLFCQPSAVASETTVLPTGATITPDAAPGSVFQSLTVDLPDYPNRAVDGAQTTAISPDGKTLLILTSGFNKLRGSTGAVQPQDSSEYVYVYDISNPSAPVKKQVVFVPR